MYAHQSTILLQPSTLNREGYFVVFMVSALRLYIKNKAKKEGATYAEEILGNTSSVHKFATFWNQNHEDMDVVFAALLHIWTRDREFSKEELEAYKEGLAVWEQFFTKCAQETEMTRAKAEQEGHQLLSLN